MAPGVWSQLVIRKQRLASEAQLWNLKICSSPSQTALPAGNQVSRHTDLWGTFHSHTPAYGFWCHSQDIFAKLKFIKVSGGFVIWDSVLRSMINFEGFLFGMVQVLTGVLCSCVLLMDLPYSSTMYCREIITMVMLSMKTSLSYIVHRLLNSLFCSIDLLLCLEPTSTQMVWSCSFIMTFEIR